MKKIIIAALSILIGACGYTIVDKEIDDRVADLEASASMYSEELSIVNSRLYNLENMTYSVSGTTITQVTHTVISPTSATRSQTTTKKTTSGKSTTPESHGTTSECTTIPQK